MDKHVNIQLNANRKVTGVLRGYDAFMNIVLDETAEEVVMTKSTGSTPAVVERHPVGMVVISSSFWPGCIHLYL